MNNFCISIMTVYNYSRFIEGHKFISFIIIVRCLPSLNKGVTLPYLTLPYLVCARNKCLSSHIVLSWKFYTYQSRHRRLDIQYNSDFLPSRQIFSRKAKCRWPLLNHHRYYDRDHDYERSCNCDLDRDCDRDRDRDRDREGNSERKCQCERVVFWLLSLYETIIRLCKGKILNFLEKAESFPIFQIILTFIWEQISVESKG